MVSTLVGYQALLLVSMLACFGVGVRAWRRRDALAADKLVWVNVATFSWALFAFLATVFRGTPAVWIPARLTIASVGLMVVALVAFTLEYTGRGEYLTRRAYVLLAVEPVVATVFAVTNGSHELFWTEGIRQAGTAMGYAQVFEIGFYLHTVYSYALLIGVVVLLGQFALRSDFLYQRQVFAIVLAMFAPWVGNALYIFTPMQYDLTPVGFAVTGVSLGWAITSVGFLDITPVARDTVVDTLEAGVFVVDTDGRLVDINQRGRALLSAADDRVTGRPATDVFEAIPDIAEYYQSLDGQRTPDSFEFTVDDRSFETTVSPLLDERDQLAGYVFLVQDITDQVERQRQLEQRNEQLDRFAGVVSHDLRNPLNVASGRLELARRTHDEKHFDAMAEAHDRMERIIEDVLTLSRTDVEDIDTTTVDLQSVAHAAWATVDTRAASLEVGDLATVEANRNLLVQLFENCYRNAVEHGGDDVTVTVGSLDDGFFIADDGPGIPEGERDAIFEDGTSEKAGGTGLGLTIVDQIADVHDWTVTATESEHGGARFEVRFGPVADRVGRLAEP